MLTFSFISLGLLLFLFHCCCCCCCCFCCSCCCGGFVVLVVLFFLFVVVWLFVVWLCKYCNHDVKLYGSSIYRGELSFLQPVHFCICWCNSAILTGYLFQQWPVCMHVPNWKNVLGVSAVIRCVPNWKNVLCYKMCLVT